MKVKIYIDWGEQEVRQEADKKAYIAELASDRLGSDYDLENFLDDLLDQTEHYRYPRAYLLNAPEEARKEILSKFEQQIYKEAEEDFNESHEEVEIEI